MFLAFKARQAKLAQQLSWFSIFSVLVFFLLPNDCWISPIKFSIDNSSHVKKYSIIRSFYLFVPLDTRMAEVSGKNMSKDFSWSSHSISTEINEWSQLAILYHERPSKYDIANCRSCISFLMNKICGKNHHAMIFSKLDFHRFQNYWAWGFSSRSQSRAA